MHVAGKPADEGFINFNFSAKLSAALLILQRQPNAVHHEPCGFLSDAKTFANFITTDSVLVIRNHPHCGEPLVKADGAILEDGPNLCGEFAPWVMRAAFPSAPRSIEADLDGATGWTGYTVRPALGNHLTQAVVRVGIVDDCFLQGLWFAHDFVLHELNHTLNKWASQVHDCPYKVLRSGRAGPIPKTPTLRSQPQVKMPGKMVA